MCAPCFRIITIRYEGLAEGEGKSEKNGIVTDQMPYDTEGWQAVYETLPGWQTDLTQMTSESQFPQQLKDYIANIEKATETPITIVSVGPDRAQTITR